MTGPIPWSRWSSAALRKRRAVLVRRPPPLKAMLRGSVIERYKRCGKPGCKCMEGPGHGPKFYLSVSVPGARPTMQYVPAEYHEQVNAFIANFRQMRTVLEEICAINLELLRRREELE
ncbi:MAG: DUF6788 family protein [Vicinamibacteraceae bacterium]